MLIVTNSPGFPGEWRAANGRAGRSVAAHSAGEFLRHRGDAEAVLLVNCDPPLALELGAAKVAGLRFRARLVSLDLVLRRPRRLAERLALPVKRYLFSRFDHHIHYFRDLRGYEELYGIGPARSSFVPFKVNLRERFHLEPAPEGDYALCLGRSQRDFDTFFAAAERVPYRLAIARPDFVQLRAHGARFTRGLAELPKNVEMLDDDGSEAAQIKLLSGARLVVLPILKSSMAASGISTCLNAMQLGKCAIGSEGPGMSDIFTDEVLTFPAEDAGALAETIRRAWEDDGLRRRTAEAGHRYALAAGGEAELYQRIVDRLAEAF